MLFMRSHKLPPMLALHGFADDVPQATRRRVVVVLACAVLAMSSSGTLVRSMEGIGPLGIAFWRCVGALVLLSPGVVRGLGALSARDAARIAVAGALLGAHFAIWFASLGHTTVMRATVLVAVTPLWTGLLEWGVLGERPPSRFWGGVAVALIGVAWLTGDLGAGTLTGDAMATVSGALWSAYFLIGRDVRSRVALTAWMGLVSGAAAAALLPALLLVGEPLVGFPTTTWLLVLAALLGPQLTGHQGASYAIRYLPARVISAVLLLEPVGATVLAWAVFGEAPPLAAALAGVVVVAGVGLATTAAQAPVTPSPAPAP